MISKINVNKLVYDIQSAVKWLEDNEQKFIITHIDGVTAYRPEDAEGMYGEIYKFNSTPIQIVLEERMSTEWDVGIHRDNLKVREFLSHLTPVEVTSCLNIINGNTGNELILNNLFVPSVKYKQMVITLIF